MTINQAFGDLISSEAYKAICKQKDSKGSKYRIYKGRYMAGKLKDLAMVAFLLEYDYGINVTAPKKAAPRLGSKED